MAFLEGARVGKNPLKRLSGAGPFLVGLLLQINKKKSSNPAIPLSKQYHISREITFVYKKSFKTLYSSSSKACK